MDDHDRGLGFDLATLRSRRQAITLFGGAGLALLAGCATGSPDTATGFPDTATGFPSTAPGGTSSAGPPGTAATSAAGTSVEEIPQETAGPFPGDGSNGPNVLTESGIVRGDIRSSFGSASGVAGGVPLTIALTVLEADTDAALAGAAVYVWHCDREGNYSLYSRAAAGENYLRGVQAADASGRVTFTSIFPAAYSGRWPHVHFEVYRSLAEVTAAGSKLTTSQLALPEDVCRTVYATGGYETSVGTLARTTLRSDMVFSDGYDRQLATVTGDVSTGFTATLAVGV